MPSYPQLPPIHALICGFVVNQRIEVEEASTQATGASVVITFYQPRPSWSNQMEEVANDDMLAKLMRRSSVHDSDSEDDRRPSNQMSEYSSDSESIAPSLIDSPRAGGGGAHSLRDSALWLAEVLNRNGVRTSLSACQLHPSHGARSV